MRNQKGKNNNAYKNGIGMYKQTKGTHCNRCGTQEKLCVHHLDEDRTNNELDNLETVCRRCHALEHDCISRLPKGKERSEMSKKVKRVKDPLTGRFIKKEQSIPIEILDQMLQFGMGHTKLKTKLRLDSGKEVSDEKTQELIDAHKSTYPQYWRWVREISNDYKAGSPLVTNDGWVLFCDNPVITSVRNFPVQANAASITRLAVTKLWSSRVSVMCSLHDAIYVISENPEKDAMIVEEVMLWATEQILKESKTTIRIDTKFIEHDEVWMEEKGEADWNKIKEFLI